MSVNPFYQNATKANRKPEYTHAAPARDPIMTELMKSDQYA
jgi:hypothetical protein